MARPGTMLKYNSSDLLVGSQDTFVLTQNANGTFTERMRAQTTVTPGPFLVGDVDADGRIDIAHGSFIYRQLPNGGFETLDTWPIGNDFLDVNLDGRADFLYEGGGVADPIFVNGAPE